MKTIRPVEWSNSSTVTVDIIDTAGNVIVDDGETTVVLGALLVYLGYTWLYTYYL